MRLEADIAFQLLFLPVLIIFSFFFSASETSFFSLKSITISKFHQSEKKKEKAIAKLLQSPNDLIITILLGNTFVNTAASILATSFILTMFQSETAGVSVAITVMTLVLLVFGETTPKVIAINHPISTAKLFVYFLRLISNLLFPIRMILKLITDSTTKIFKADKSFESLSDKELSTVIKVGLKEGAINVEEKEMLNYVLKSISKQAKEIMTPIGRIKCVESAWNAKKITSFIINTEHRRIPVISGDRITGMIYKKEILPFYLNNKKLPQLMKFSRPVLYVDEDRSPADILSILQEKRMKIAVVADKSGASIGIITLSDLLAEIMGKTI